MSVRSGIGGNSFDGDIGHKGVTTAQSVSYKPTITINEEKIELSIEF